MGELLSPAPMLLMLALLAAPAALVAGRFRVDLAAPVGGVFTVGAFVCALWGYRRDTPDVIDWPWLPTWGLRLQFSLDGLAVLYALLATGIGALVVLYAWRYIPLHLHHEHRDEREVVPFFGSILLFMGAMVGLVMAQDLILMFIFWDLTAVASFLLIGYDRNEKANSAALMAILVTGISAICLLIAAVMFWYVHGTTSLPELIAVVEPGKTLSIAGLLILVAGLAKSAQVPLHFWLPRAMAAPTPVSAYLHSAAMVAAGVFLVGRFYPLLLREQWLLDTLLVIGFLSMGVAGVIALTRQELKQILAYSTISQYGYIVVMFGLGGAYGVAGASFYVIAHALAKAALFLTAGTVTEATGTARLGELGGLRRSMPVLAVGSAAAASGLAALPATVGFFKDEVFFHAALDRGPIFAVLALFGAVLTFAYIGRFWLGIFFGRTGAAVTHTVSPLLVVPILVLGVLTLVFGLVPSPVTDLAMAAGSVSFNAPIVIRTAYHFDTRPENLLALATFALGGTLLLTHHRWRAATDRFARLGDWVGPARLYQLTLNGLNGLSTILRRYEVRDLRTRVATILAPAGLLVVLGLLATGTVENPRFGPIVISDLPLILVLIVTAAAALTATLSTNHFTLVLVLSGVGFSLAAVYAFFEAPDVALVAVLIETIFTLVFFGILALLPRWVLREVEDDPSERGEHIRDAILATAAGVLVFLVAWVTLSRPTPASSVAEEHIRLAPDAHAYDIVTVILADFRGLDTIGEITVVGIGLLGIATFIHRGRLRQ